MMETPLHYNNILQSSLDIQVKYKLTDIQTLLYDHCSRGDFVLRNNDGQKFYDINNEGFGYSGDRGWVKKQFSKLIRAGLINFESVYDCRGARNTSWYFWNKNFNRDTLVDASCYVRTHKLALIKYYLNLPDGFSKNATYGDLKLIRDSNGFTFSYKGEENIWAWDHNGEGKKQDLNWIVRDNDFSRNRYQQKDGITCYKQTQYRKTFSELVHDIWSHLAFEGKTYINNIPNYSRDRIFNLKKITII